MWGGVKLLPCWGTRPYRELEGFRELEGRELEGLDCTINFLQYYNTPHLTTPMYYMLFFHNRLAYENIVPQETHLSLTEKLINLGLQKFDTVVPTVYSN